MTVASYVKFLSLLETPKENTKAIRIWALNLTNELVTIYLNNPTTESTDFLRAMARENNLDISFLIEALNFIVTNESNPNISKIIGILCVYPSIVLAQKVIKIEDYKIDVILRLLRVRPPQENILMWITEIINTTSKTKAEAIFTIYSSKTFVDDDIYDYFLAKLKEASTKETIEDILIEYRTYIRDIIKRNADIYSLPTEDFIKSLESCPDLLTKEISIESIEIAISRMRRRKENEEA